MSGYNFALDSDLGDFESSPKKPFMIVRGGSEASLIEGQIVTFMSDI